MPEFQLILNTEILMLLAACVCMLPRITNPIKYTPGWGVDCVVVFYNIISTEHEQSMHSCFYVAKLLLSSCLANCLLQNTLICGNCRL